MSKHASTQNTQNRLPSRLLKGGRWRRHLVAPKDRARLIDKAFLYLDQCFDRGKPVFLQDVAASIERSVASLHHNSKMSAILEEARRLKGLQQAQKSLYGGLIEFPPREKTAIHSVVIATCGWHYQKCSFLNKEAIVCYAVWKKKGPDWTVIGYLSSEGLTEFREGRRERRAS